MLDLSGKSPLELSKLGDPLVNLIYSLALTEVYEKPLCKKVSNSVLAEAVEKAGLREIAGRRKRRGELGDFAEGLIFKAWAERRLTIEEAVEILAGSLEPGTGLRESSIKGFETLLRRAGYGRGGLSQH